MAKVSNASLINVEVNNNITVGGPVRPSGGGISGGGGGGIGGGGGTGGGGGKPPKPPETPKPPNKSYKRFNKILAESNLTLARFYVILRRVAFAFVAMKVINVIIGSLNSFVEEVVRGNAQMEVFSARLEQFIGNAKQVPAALKFIEREAVTTPFEIPDIVQATVYLKTFGLSAKKWLRIAADAAAATAPPTRDLSAYLRDTAIRMGKVAIGSSRTAQILPTLGISIAEWNKALAESGDRLTALQKVLSKFSGQSERLSKTMLGTISNIKDILGILGRRAGFLVFRSISEDVRNLYDALNNFNADRLSTIAVKLDNLYQTIKAFGNTIKNNLGFIGKFIGYLLLLKFAASGATKIVSLGAALIPVFKTISNIFSLFKAGSAATAISTIIRSTNVWIFGLTIVLGLIGKIVFDYLKAKALAEKFIQIHQQGIGPLKRVESAIKQIAESAKKVKITDIMSSDDIKEATIRLQALQAELLNVNVQLQNMLDEKNVGFFDRLFLAAKRGLSGDIYGAMRALGSSIEVVVDRADRFNSIVQSLTGGKIKTYKELQEYIERTRKALDALKTPVEEFNDFDNVLQQTKDELKGLHAYFRDVSSAIIDIFEVMKRFGVSVNVIKLFRREFEKLLGKQRTDELERQVRSLTNLNEQFKLISKTLAEGALNALNNLDEFTKNAIKRLKTLQVTLSTAIAGGGAIAAETRTDIVNTIEDINDALSTDRIKREQQNWLIALANYLKNLLEFNRRLQQGTGIAEWDNQINASLNNLRDLGQKLINIRRKVDNAFFVKQPELNLIPDVNKSLPILERVDEILKSVRQSVEQARGLIPEETITKINDLMNQLRTTAERAVGESGAVTEEQLNNLLAVIQKINAELENQGIQIEFQMSRWKNLVSTVQGIMSPIQNIFTSLVKGTKNFGETVKNVLRSIVENIAATVAKIVTLYLSVKLVSALFGAPFGGFTLGNAASVVLGAPIQSFANAGATPLPSVNIPQPIVNVTPNFSVNVPVVLDGDVVARAVENVSEREL